MNTVKSGDTVRVLYSIILDNGARFRPLHDGDTLRFTLGRGAVLAGFERALLDMAQGETRRVRVPAAEAYGEARADKIFTVRRSDVLPEVEPLSVGDVVRVASAPEGDFFAIVREMSDSEILLDANHPLCGQDITFEIQLLEVSPPDADPSAGAGRTDAAPRRNGTLHAAAGS
jgi:peptidylprolyl isomerase